ncbi:cysteate synthase [Methanocella conradii HZ254]|uniref:Cysteate synthase n=1 Tax=Methanocella conradii (strain DSM 24694 / JCM 17849 / CGMCC 1.5162 / HZ254) TaxID=1041930 RepID=H8I5Y6_METCZ|nr:cysteate synthase [Methanocella conradii]AFD00220.1 cysteate synthase [Methanocella conradii HZ254]
MGAYTLECPWCGRSITDHYTLRCDTCDGLIRAKYGARQLSLKSLPGMWRYYDWLPAKGYIDTPGKPITYKSEGLAKELGLKDLYISFNGYWPEMGAHMDTCSFKELEAPPTIVRAREHGGRAMVLASAGNTARAFAHISTITGFPVILVVPETGAHNIWIPGREPGDAIKLITMEKGNDYSDAIKLSERISALNGMMPEGGARNVARRDGMGVAMLDAAVFMKRMPDDYFQAIGSGTGGIAAWEAALRLREDGRFGERLPRLRLAQNLPFAPMYRAWKAGRRDIVPELDMPDAKKQISEMYTDILSNRNPPYGIKGGVYDALADTGGEMYAITNDEAIAAKKVFEDSEGIDILPPAAVAVAALMQACENGLDKRRSVLLNITGGGFERIKKEKSINKVEPCLKVSGPDVPLDDMLKVIGWPALSEKSLTL